MADVTFDDPRSIVVLGGDIEKGSWTLQGDFMYLGNYSFNIALEIAAITIQTERQTADKSTMLTGAAVLGTEGALLGMAASKTKETCALVHLCDGAKFIAIMREESYQLMLAMTLPAEKDAAQARQDVRILNTAAKKEFQVEETKLALEAQNDYRKFSKADQELINQYRASVAWNVTGFVLLVLLFFLVFPWLSVKSSGQDPSGAIFLNWYGRFLCVAALVTISPFVVGLAVRPKNASRAITLLKQINSKQKYRAKELEKKREQWKENYQKEQQKVREQERLKRQLNNTMKKCPYCAEEIRLEAIKCKHCGSDLS